MLSSHEKRKLSAEANTLPTLLQIGKNGVTDVFIEELARMIKKKRLVKVKFLKSIADTLEPKEEALNIALKAKLELVGIVGHTMIFYDPHALKKQ